MMAGMTSRPLTSNAHIVIRAFLSVIAGRRSDPGRVRLKILDGVLGCSCRICTPQNKSSSRRDSSDWRSFSFSDHGVQVMERLIVRHHRCSYAGPVIQPSRIVCL